MSITADKLEKPVSFIAVDSEMNRILGVLANSQFTVSDTPQSSRTMNYYEEKGLLLSTREATQGWRRFSANELVWLYIIDHLRTFGYPVELIKAIRDDMMQHPGGTVTNGVYDVRPFEWFIAISLTAKKEMFYIVFPDGSHSYYSDDDPHLWNKSDSYMRQPHISIPLAPIIKEIWSMIPKESIDFELPNMENVTRTEKQILHELRSGKYLKVEVQFKNKKPEYITGFEKKEIKRIEEILREHRFQKLQLIEADGKVVSIIREVKKKLK